MTSKLHAGSLSLETTRGSVRLTSWDRPTVEIRAWIESPRFVGGDYARRAVEGTTIDVTGDGHAVSIRSDYSGVPRRGLFFWGRSVPQVHYEIRAPRQLDLDLKINRSDTTVHGFEGRLVLDLHRSDLDAADLTGEIAIDLHRGALDARRFTGQVSLDVGRGQRVVLDGLRGSLRLDLHRTNAALRDVRIDDDSHVKISRGDLDVQLDASQALTIEADLSRARLTSDLPAKMQSDRKFYATIINNGGPTLRITAHRSRVRLDTN